MKINAIDHINILTDDLEKTTRFYAKVLGLEQGEAPSAAVGFKGAWMRDSMGNAIVHIVWKNPESNHGSKHNPGDPTAAIHHVAFRCKGYEETIEKFERENINFRSDGKVRDGVRQIVLRDPNNINIELNFTE